MSQTRSRIFNYSISLIVALLFLGCVGFIVPLDLLYFAGGHGHEPRLTSQRNLKMLALTLNVYQFRHKSYPPGALFDKLGRRG